MTRGLVAALLLMAIGTWSTPAHASSPRLDNAWMVELSAFLPTMGPEDRMLTLDAPADELSYLGRAGGFLSLFGPGLDLFDDETHARRVVLQLKPKLSQRGGGLVRCTFSFD